MSCSTPAAVAHSSLLSAICCAATALVALSCASEENIAPRLLSLEDQLFEVNRAHQLELQGFDEDGDPLTFSYQLDPMPRTESEGAGSPRLQQVGQNRAIFTWTPGAADAGGGSQRYRFTAEVSDDRGGRASETISLEVRAAQQGDEEIRFIAPMGNGTLLDLNVSPCLEDLLIAVEAPRLRSEQVELLLAAPSPVSARLGIAGPKQVTLRWCPSEIEINQSLSYPFIFEARGENGERAQKSFLVQLRPIGGGEDCNGEAPEIRHTPLEDQRGLLGYWIEATIVDDQPLPAPPSLFYQLLPPEAPLPERAAGDWTLLPFEAGEGGDRWRVRIPFPGLREGEQLRVAYQIVAVDDNDPAGTRCDYRSESPLFSFLAIGDESGTRAELCEPCELDRQCIGGTACISSTGGREERLCLPRCSSGCGMCLAAVSADGESGEWCTAEESCGGAASCTPDQFEQGGGNESPALASPLSAGASLTLTLCRDDVDVFSIAASETPLELRLELLDGGATLSRYDQDGLPGPLEMLGAGAITQISAPPTTLLELRALPGIEAQYRIVTVRQHDGRCELTRDCPSGEYCADGRCVEERCVEQQSCGPNHRCRARTAGRLPSPGSPGRCRISCGGDGSCRVELGYRCKRFDAFEQSCAPAGVAQLGERCESHEDCAGAMICLGSGGAGYCVLGGCDQDSECPQGSYCGGELGSFSCLPPCAGTCPEGALCEARFDGVSLCVP
ncbi:MAG: hypothetical protein VYD19_07180 [Myxococcota bacterium]|nr:hypothetical protein [Myxococcota bacterium]